MGTLTDSYSVDFAMANPQKCPGVHRKISAAIRKATTLIDPVTAAQPASAENEPAAPPITIFHFVLGFNHKV
jgi:hypothetical protein